MIKQVDFYVKNVYGAELAFAANPEQKNFFKQMSRRDSIALNEMKNFAKLGFVFKQVPCPNFFPNIIEA